ncbi:unnamed protein product, partial [Amoebophrya sp. A25]
QEASLSRCANESPTTASRTTWSYDKLESFGASSKDVDNDRFAATLSFRAGGVLGPWFLGRMT